MSDSTPDNPEVLVPFKAPGATGDVIAVRKYEALKAVLRTWSASDLLECLSQTEVIEMVADDFDAAERDELLRLPEHEEIRRRNLLDDNLEGVRLCGNAQSPLEERQIYLDRMKEAS